MLCDHVAVLVPDLVVALSDLGPLAAEAKPAEDFPEEGTREVYVGNGSGRLLLLQPIGPAPYQRALERRGPGLHHVGLAGPDPGEMMESLAGWLLHPHSLASGPDTLWASRPGLPLVELLRGAPAGEPLVSGLELACPVELKPLIERLACPGFDVSFGPRTRLTLGDHLWVPPG